MKKSTVIVPKASSYNFDNTTMYNLQEKVEIDLITEKFNRSLRPKPENLLNKPIPKPNKDTLDIDHPGSEVVRNKTKKIPHKDSSIVMYNFGVGPRFAYVSASVRAPK
jgi:hypothetical protein